MEQITEISIKEISLSGFRNQKEPVSFALGDVNCVTGHNGTGKTTLAHKLQHALGRGTLVISQDVIRRDMLWARDTGDGPALPLLMYLVRYGRQHCEYVILEGILFSET